MSAPLVSICCLTYNHAPFIKKCLDGFLMQEKPSCVPADAKMSDWCEILIHDDCSTDGTIEILKEYEAKYPDLIFPLYEKENKYSNGYKGKMDLFNYIRAKGKYIAYCEGDDYWTDELKLQKQVDFLESNIEYSVCWHCINVVDENNRFIRNGKSSSLLEKSDVGVGIDTNLFFKAWYTQPMSMVFKTMLLDLDYFNKYTFFVDTPQIYQLLKVGKGYILNFKGGCYRVHSNSFCRQYNEFDFEKIELKYALEIYKNNNDECSKAYCIKNIRYLYSLYVNINI